MKMILEIPEEISEQLNRNFGNPARAALEALAAAAYSQDVLSLEQVRCLLGLETAWEGQAILAKFGAWPGMTLADFHDDMAALATLQPHA